MSGQSPLIMPGVVPSENFSGNESNLPSHPRPHLARHGGAAVASRFAPISFELRCAGADAVGGGSVCPRDGRVRRRHQRGDRGGVEAPRQGPHGRQRRGPRLGGLGPARRARRRHHRREAGGSRLKPWGERT